MLRQGIARGAWLITLTPGVLSAGVIAAGLGGGGGGAGVVETGAWAAREVRVAPAPSAPRIECPAPSALRLRRFEDGSAQLLCRDRVIVRISVPG